MNGNAKIKLRPNQAQSKELKYRNIHLSYRTELHQALISRIRRGEPEELYCIEGATIDIFTANSKETVSIQGFIQDESGKFDACIATFMPISESKI